MFRRSEHSVKEWTNSKTSSRRGQNRCVVLATGAGASIGAAGAAGVADAVGATAGAADDAGVDAGAGAAASGLAR